MCPVCVWGAGEGRACKVLPGSLAFCGGRKPGSTSRYRARAQSGSSRPRWATSLVSLTGTCSPSGGTQYDGASPGEMETVSEEMDLEVNFSWLKAGPGIH